MGYYMNELYRRYFRATGFSGLEEEIENTRQEVRNYLNQAQRQTLMHLIDAQEQLKAELAQVSFEAGFRLAMGLLRELEDKRIRLQLEEEG
ncbi:DUF6809 family protein [Flavonifractor hominis]|uniref:DUF6809 family protein n=1 Tax=Flavonifractor hominis TaxID=3133178 RepID=A0ABV1EPL6_9FIRM